jgi:NADPH-dependent 2,4-dienoyl-CoA reductase/sulfur reductase-like enzyme
MPADISACRESAPAVAARRAEFLVLPDDVVVIGAGAAGMMCAAQAGQRGAACC